MTRHFCNGKKNKVNRQPLRSFCEGNSRLSIVLVSIQIRQSPNSNQCDRCRRHAHQFAAISEEEWSIDDVILNEAHSELTNVPVRKLPMDANEPAIVEMCSPSFTTSFWLDASILTLNLSILDHIIDWNHSNNSKFLTKCTAKMLNSFSFWVQHTNEYQLYLEERSQKSVNGVVLIYFFGITEYR